MKYLSIAWNVVKALVYVALVIGILSVAGSKFETLVLAGLVELYAAVLFNFSLLGESADINNHAAFVRFRILAAVQGITENEDGPFAEQENALADLLKSGGPKVWIMRISNAIVSVYAIVKIVQVIL